ncbi:tubulin-tyrosine ligase [Plenodomus tracheiphilus IPT5]|uniref:Tubulin-tyrosine ligase n=1 Tax=Plenodomus tracheiphilus IPT5 TaxID=1408161 RepID=A0A6A7BAK1_9PLEO|nr:tubulin-tyrosine ligase [Plenodomus tracheiphilus IPT5]
MASQEPQPDETIYCLIDYEDPYVQPLLLSALSKRLPPSSYKLISSLSELPTPTSRLLQWVQYESIDFDHLMSHPTTSLANAYIIRKALIRKHYLSTTVSNWVTKHPDSVLRTGVKPSVEFEVDYAEFLDDALVEAWELKESWAKGEGKEDKEREWWILKPGMSERGQGIRLFSCEEELTGIFEEWDPESDDEEEEDDDEDEDAHKGNGIITSQLRHFIAQPYIHPPLLLSPPSSSSPPTTTTNTTTPNPHASRKFHIRTYVLATGALKIHIYRPMLALFAARDYIPPWAHQDLLARDNRDEALKAHLTNTCLQETGEREGSVGLFWELPDQLPGLSCSASSSSSSTTTTNTQTTTADNTTTTTTWKAKVFKDICNLTSETFEAAARTMPTHFQALPNSFEIFGLDFMVSVEQDKHGEAGLRTWLMEVNAFPDFRQSGGEGRGLVEGLMEGVVGIGVKGWFGVGGVGEGEEDMVKVLDIDLGRR